ncbi:unnamed protein product, partial [Polarella glacialis]
AMSGAIGTTPISVPVRATSGAVPAQYVTSAAYTTTTQAAVAAAPVAYATGAHTAAGYAYSSAPAAAPVMPVASQARYTYPSPGMSSTPADGASSSSAEADRGVEIPDVQIVRFWKKAYAKSLDAQLEQGTRMLEQQNEVQKQALVQAADMKKQQYFMQVDQQLKAQEMSVDQQANYQLMGLQQAAHERRALLEQQANAAILDYEQKRVQDEFARTQYDYQRKAAQKQ